MAQQQIPAEQEGHPREMGELHPHPTWHTYWKIAVILTVLTIAEVSFYYMGWEESRVYVPAMLIMSGIKFLLVVMYYMHLKYDARLFRSLFAGPLLVAAVTIMALLLLFGQVVIRLRGG